MQQHHLNCSLPQWYPRYHCITFKTKIIPLPMEFMEYLHADGIFLPVNADGEEDDSAFYQRDRDVDYDTDSVASDHSKSSEYAGTVSDNHTDSSCEETNAMHKRYAFPELMQSIQDAIQDLGGAVLPKLDWSSPKDAVWISLSGTLRCTSAQEICLLLKASDFIVHDLNVGGRNHSFHLVLRRWHTIHPAMEFRCFVSSGRLVAVSQRDDCNYYDFLHTNAKELRQHIVQFWYEHFSDFAESEYVFDVYVTRESEQDTSFVRKVWLMDINPFVPETDAILFSWEEIREMNAGSNDEPELRLLFADEAGRSAAPRYSTSMLPQEAVLLSQGWSLADLASQVRK